MRPTFKARFAAAGAHLGISIFIAALAAALVLWVWYPFPYREISGGRELFMLVTAVDVVLGPLITFAIFDIGKERRELKRDIALVAVLQLAALAFGLHTVWQARPVYLAFEVDRFRVVRAIDIDDTDLKDAPQSLRSLPKWGPEVIWAEPPAAQGDVMNSIQLALAGRDISVQPKTWRPYATATTAVLRRAKPLSLLRQTQPRRRVEVDKAVQALGLPEERLAFVPMIARRTDWVALVDSQTAAIVGYLPFGGFE